MISTTVLGAAAEHRCVCNCAAVLLALQPDAFCQKGATIHGTVPGIYALRLTCLCAILARADVLWKQRLNPKGANLSAWLSAKDSLSDRCKEQAQHMDCQVTWSLLGPVLFGTRLPTRKLGKLLGFCGGRFLSVHARRKTLAGVGLSGHLEIMGLQNPDLMGSVCAGTVFGMVRFQRIRKQLPHSSMVCKGGPIHTHTFLNMNPHHVEEESSSATVTFLNGLQEFGRSNPTPKNPDPNNSKQT